MSTKKTRIPVAIVTGFLGSGKTTLLSHILRHQSMQSVAVIVNEFGAVSIDHKLVRKTSENVIELRNGCVCCTIRGDLVMTLRDLQLRCTLGEIAPFDYVVVETTGLADPVPLLHTLITNEPISQHYYPDVVIACADAEHFEQTVVEHDCGETQIALADVVLVTKADRVSDSRVSSVCRLVNDLNPGAQVLEVVHGCIDANTLFRRGLFEPTVGNAGTKEWLQRALASPAHDHGEGFLSHVLSASEPISVAGAAVLLNRLVNLEDDPVLRIKGILWSRERPGQAAVVHAVRNKFYPLQWLEDVDSLGAVSHLVVIARSLDQQALETMFQQHCVECS